MQIILSMGEQVNRNAVITSNIKFYWTLLHFENILDNYTSYYDIIICNHARAYTFYADVVSLKNTYTFNSCLDESSAIHELCYENLGILSFDKLYL